VLDAGSSGTRAYLYYWPEHSGDKRELLRWDLGIVIIQYTLKRALAVTRYIYTGIPAIHSGNVAGMLVRWY
jgi:hypothetical protein